MRVTMFDYGAGNLHSLAKALTLAGGEVAIETDPARCLKTDVLVLPGVGAFGHAVARLAPARDAMRDSLRNGLPTIGICLGMQLLFDGSDEGPGEGLGIIAGRCERLRATRVPQIGWNTLDCATDSVFDSTRLSTVYYANSFVARPSDASSVIAWSTHEADRFPAAVRAGRAIGVQFHPEKSSTSGIQFLRALLAECAQ